MKKGIFLSFAGLVILIAIGVSFCVEENKEVNKIQTRNRKKQMPFQKPSCPQNLHIVFIRDFLLYCKVTDEDLRKRNFLYLAREKRRELVFFLKMAKNGDPVKVARDAKEANIFSHEEYQEVFNAKNKPSSKSAISKTEFKASGKSWPGFKKACSTKTN